jgi:hypothetical protein
LSLQGLLYIILEGGKCYRKGNFEQVSGLAVLEGGEQFEVLKIVVRRGFCFYLLGGWQSSKVIHESRERSMPAYEDNITGRGMSQCKAVSKC